MIKFWLKVVQLPSDMLLKAAYEDLLSQGKTIMATKNKRQFRQKGLSFVWNEGRGPTDINTNWENEIKTVLENQIIQNWIEEFKKKRNIKVL